MIRLDERRRGHIGAATVDVAGQAMVNLCAYRETDQAVRRPDRGRRSQHQSCRCRVHAIIGRTARGRRPSSTSHNGSARSRIAAGYSFSRPRHHGCRPHVISRLGIKRTLQVKSVFPELNVADNL